MKTKKFLFYLLVSVLGGCVPVMSIHQLYNDRDLVFEKSLVGDWTSEPNNLWQFSCQDESQKAYNLLFTNKDNKKGSFIVYLVKLGNKFFFDVYPADLPWGEKAADNIKWPNNACFFRPTHTFVKINSIEPQLKVQGTDDDAMKKFLKEDPNAIRHETLPDGRFILTASTRELQAFVLKYADDKRVFTSEMVLSRKISPEPNSLGEKKSDK